VQLPFTHDQFLDLFGDYNRALWPALVLLWGVTLVSIVNALRRRGKVNRLVTIMLTVHWTWNAVFYHLMFFRRINGAAAAFGILFLAQAGLLAWRGIARSALSYEGKSSGWRMLGIGLIAYAMFYPLLGIAFGLAYPRLPVVGVPCPTAILTAGFLLLAPRREVRVLGWIPILWAGIGGSAAFLLGIQADLALPVAGLLVAGRMLAPDSRDDADSSRSVLST
jgi:hypothetical protein